MKNKSAMETTAITTEKNAVNNFGRVNSSTELKATNEVMDNLIAEGGENFLNYLNRLGLVNDSNTLVLPSNQHYYYDNSELQGVTTLINMKKLNMIRHLDSFLDTLCNVMAPKTNFIGCFSDSDNQKNNGFYSRMRKGLINFLDSKTDNDIDRKDVSRILETQGYKIMDMTVINGLTYFRTQYTGNAA
jgi:hypothetical protein